MILSPPKIFSLLLLLVVSQTSLAQQDTVLPAQQPPVKTDRQLIDRYRVNQQRARDLTADLLAILVDTQMLQLEDNRLTDLPLYDDLKTMRGRMGELAMKKMPGVIELLVQADAADAKDRKAIMNSVHLRMRQVLRDLLRERERLRLRRQQAELVERIGEIVLKQRSTLQASLSLTPTLEQLVLTTIDAQENVSVLVVTFHETLNLVSDWPGELGALAKECSRVLTTNKIDYLLVQAESQLKATEFSAAVTTEKEIIGVLESILLQIRRFEDPAWIDSDAAQAADAIISAQEALKEKVEVVDADDSQQVDALVQEQTVIREKLQRLESLVAGNQEADDLLDRALEAATDARQDIFEGQIDDALAEQEEIIGTLAELREELKTPINLLDPDLTSEEYEQIADALAEAGEKLEQADQLNDNAADQLASENNPAATASEQEANKAVDEAGAVEKVIDSVKEAIDDAAQATAEAAGALKDADGGKPPEDPAQADAQQAVADAGDEIKEAIGRAQEAEDEARKNALATKLGELNRAVDALERAAAKARENAAVIGDDNPPTPQQTAAVQQDFDTTGELAKDVAEGVENLTPEAIDSLHKAADKSNNLANTLPENIADEGARKSKAQQADQVAQQLEDAADKIRKDVVDTAEKLVDELKEQIASVNDIQQDLNQLALNDSPPTTEQLDQLSDKTLQKLPDAGKALQNAAEASEQIGTEPAGEPDKPAGEPGKPAGEPDKPAGEPGKPADPETTRDRQVLQAEVIADIKEEQLLEDLLQAQQLALLAEQGKESAADLADFRKKLEKATGPDDPHTPSPNELFEAVMAQAESLAGIGQLASEIAEQEKIANEPILDAAELARELGQPAAPQLAANTPPAEPGAAASPAPPGSPAQPGETPAGEQPGQPAPPGQTAASQPPGSPPATPATPLAPNDSFVPENTFETAELMAGTDLGVTPDPFALDEFPFEGLAGEPGEPVPGQPAAPDQPMPGATPMPGQAAPTSAELSETPMPAGSAGEGGAESKGKLGASENEGPQDDPVEVVEAKTDGDSQVPGGRGKDADVPPLGSQQSPWLASLPKSVQQAIKSGNKRTLPRGYEDRLKRYFNSIK